MVPQFVMLLWGAELLDEGLLTGPASAGSGQQKAVSGTRRRGFLVALIVLGVAGSVYEVCMFRFFTLISDHFAVHQHEGLTSDGKLGGRTYALRQIYEGLKRRLPDRAIVQHNPNTSPGDLFYGLYADRQTAAETSGCGVVFGGDPALCSDVIRPLTDLFEKPGAIQANQVDTVCQNLSISALVVKDTDKVWADKNSWVWKKQPVLANDYARAFLCGRGANHNNNYRSR